MSRRRLRLHGELAALAGELETLASITRAKPEIESAREIALRTLQDFLLPRLAIPRPPLLVALIGSTGAGKSTLLNSLAGEIISPAGVLRPTTRISRYWASADHAALLRTGDSQVVIGSHPLLETLVLVDTPDLDSDLSDHRTEAMAVADRADAILFVTTASRYGDAIVWETLTELSVDRPVAVVLNRTPSRASGARTDLASRLGRSGLEQVSVFTISEQRIDPARLRLPPQATQRVAAYLRGLSTNSSRLDSAIQTTVEALTKLMEWITQWNRRQTERAAVIEADLKLLEAEVEKLSTTRRRWRKRQPPPTEVLKRAQEATILRNTIIEPVSLDRLRNGWQVLVDADFEGIWSE